MATWSRNKVDSSTLNRGNEYEKGDRVSREQLNAIVNAGLYAQDFAEALSDSPDTTEANIVGVPSVETVDYEKNGKTYKKFKFSNLKGEQGIQGEKGLPQLVWSYPSMTGAESLSVGTRLNIFNSEFNRVPVVNDIFITLGTGDNGRTYILVFVCRGAGSLEATYEVLLKNDITGEKGEAGESIYPLTINYSYSATSSPSIGKVINFSLGDFNRIPVAGESFLMLYVVSNGSTYACWCNVNNVTTGNVVVASIYNFANITGEKGEQGETGTIDNSVLLNTIYPIGSIYITTKTTTLNSSPASWLGGTWTLLKDKFLIGAGGLYSLGASGGSTTKTLSVSNLPSHSHTIPVASYSFSGGSYGRNVIESGSSTQSSGNTGSGSAFDIMPPYLAVNIWERTS